MDDLPPWTVTSDPTDDILVPAITLTLPADSTELSPLTIEMEPEAPDALGALDTITEPLTSPSIDDIDPSLVVDMPNTDTEPSLPDPTNTEPPSTLPDPATIEILPDTSDTLSPDEILTDPERPDTLEPDINEISPLDAPAPDDDALRTEIEPLEPLALAPPDTNTDPPEPPKEDPPSIDTEPPDDEPDMPSPPDSDNMPPDDTPPVEIPASMFTEPPDIPVPSPAAIFTEPPRPNDPAPLRILTSPPSTPSPADTDTLPPTLPDAL
jgi:hypothetical protein